MRASIEWKLSCACNLRRVGVLRVYDEDDLRYIFACTVVDNGDGSAEFLGVVTVPHLDRKAIRRALNRDGITRISWERRESEVRRSVGFNIAD